MALKPKALYIAFDKGLDTYSNPHIIEAGKLTSASGVAIDRPGYVYPGPTLGANVATGALYQNATERYGLASYVSGQPTAQDTVLAWTAQADGSFPFRPIAESPFPASLQPLTTSLLPVRQSTKTIASFIADAASGHIGIPVACNAMAGPVPIVAYAWISSVGSLVLLRQNVATGVTESLLRLEDIGGGVLAFSPIFNASQTINSVSTLSICSDNLGTLYILAMGAYGTTIFSVSGALGSPTTTQLFTAPFVNYSSQDAVSSVAGSPGYISYRQAAGVVTASVFNGVLSAFTLTIPAAATGGTSREGCITSWIDTSQNPLVAAQVGIAASARSRGNVIAVALANLDLTGLVNFDITMTNSGPLSQISVVPTTSAAGASVLVIAGESAVLGGTEGSNLSIGAYTVSTATYLATGSLGRAGGLSTWGGVALVGKGTTRLASLASSVSPIDVVFPIRGGWYNDTRPDSTTTATTPTGPAITNHFFFRGVANPNGYLMNMVGQVVAKWGDSDYGHPRLWSAFSSEVGDGATACLSGPCVIPTGGTSDHTTLWPWPQLSYAESISLLPTNNAGYPVNPSSALATVAFTRDKTVGTNTPPRQLGTTTMLSTSLTAYFDGTETFEAGFLTRSPVPSFVDVNPDDLRFRPPGLLTPGSTYYYVTVMQYTDASGRVHNAAPSLPMAVVLSPVQTTVNLSYASILTTLKGRSMTPARLQLYRTVATSGAVSASGLSFYLANAGQDYTLNVSGTVTSIAGFTDIQSDVSLSRNTLIYTNGQAGGAAAGTKSPPPFDSVTSWQNAFWGVANRNGPELWFTWPLDNSPVGAEAPSWSSANRVPLPADLGQPLAVVGLDSNLIILGTNADYALSGSLPQRNSSLADEPGLLSAPTKLPTPGGLKVRNAITFLPTGILFQGTQGFTLLDRSLSYQPVGLPVRNLTNAGVYGPGVLYPEQGCCILPPADGISPPLAYYYFEEKWSTPAYTPAGTFRPGAAPSAPSLSQWQAVSGAVRSRLTSGSPQVVAFEPDVTKPGINVLQPGGGYLQARTPWIEMEQSSVVGSDIASVAGYGQLEEVQIQGDLLTPISHTITLQTEYDYVGNTQTPPDVQVITNVVPEVGPATAPSAPDWQFRLGFKTTLARRVRFTLTFQVTDMAVLAAGDPVVLISGLMLYYGVDDGLSRMGSSGAGYGS